MKNFYVLHRQLFYLIISVIIVTTKILPKETTNDFKRLNYPRQMFEQKKMFPQHDIKKYLDGRHSFVDSMMQLNLLPNEKPQTKKLNNAIAQSNGCVADTVIIFNTSDTVRQIYTYNVKGINTGQTFQQWSNYQWENKSRTTYTYDANGEWSSSLGVQWFNNQWVSSIQYIISDVYGINGRLSSLLEKQWQNDQWVNVVRDTYTFDTNGWWISYLHEQWQNNQWVNVVRGTYTYDTNGIILSDLNENWTNNQWVNRYRVAYVYDEHLTSIFLEEWINDQWVKLENYFTTYDAFGNRLTELEECWINNGLFISRNTYTYDTNRNMQSDFYEEWINNQWVNSGRVSCAYDAKGNRQSYLSEVWINDQWVNRERFCYTYSINGNVLSELYERWRDNQWVNDSRTNYKYFQNKFMSEFTFERWENSSWVPTNGYSYYFEDSFGNGYSYEGYKIIFSYKLIITDVNKNDGMTFKEYSLSQNYPNPFNPSTILRYNVPERSTVRLFVYNTLGQKISEIVSEMKSAGSYEQTFDASKLSSGIYFYRIEATSEQNSSKTFVNTKKMILMK